MSVKKLFKRTKQASSIGKYLKKSSLVDVKSAIESSEQLAASVNKQESYLPAVDYADPKEFAKFGSAEEYYDNAFSHVLNNYPYDGSKLEKVDFYNSMNPLEKWVFENKYPTSTGFVVLGNTYGSVTSGSSGYFSSSKEYIEILGGPHATTVYSTGSNRTNNLEFGGISGSTVEFFYKKALSIPGEEAQSDKQVIFDVHNGYASGSSGYGRLRIEVFSGSEDRFRVTMRSGTTGFITQSVPTTGGLSTTNDTWNFYSFVFNTSGSIPSIDFYVDGANTETNITGSGLHVGRVDLVTGSLVGTIGALVAPPAGYAQGGTVYKGYGKLSASLDEFRFWKKARNAAEVGRYWLAPVHGGADKYLANVDLGVYYKFNEGTTSVDATDKIVLDYSGRITNGTWRGYETSGIRRDGSALDERQISSVSEIADPIVRSPNSNLTTIQKNLADLGREYDYSNTAHLINSIPAWITEEDENSTQELRSITQIVANYFDTLHLQISQLSKIKDLGYISGSATGSIEEFPHNDRLVGNYGLEVSDLFENAGILENYFKRDEQINFEQDIVSVKNTIYRNLYNNLNHIFKSKGNEKSIRNTIRCFGIDEGIVSLNTYGVDSSYKLQTQYKPAISSKKYVDFTGLLNQGDVTGSVYQYYNSDVSGAWGTIYGDSGSATLQEFGFTTECEVIFPSFQNTLNLGYDYFPVITSSLFGFHTPETGSTGIQYNTDTTVTGTAQADPTSAAQDWGLQVRAIKSPAPFSEVFSPPEKVKDAYFVVQDRDGAIIASSSIFQNVYDNQKWNFALSVTPTKYQLATGILGSFIDISDGYELSFYGVNYDTGIKRNAFQTTLSLDYPSGSNIVTSAKRLFVGAHKTNFTGSVKAYSDVKASSLRYWSDLLPTGTVDLHAKEVDTYGRQNPTRDAYEFQARNPGMYIPRAETLALNWDFADVTGSSASGQFNVLDRSSGSFVPVDSATATVVFAGSIVNNQSIAIVSTDGTSRTYIAKAANDYANNEFNAGSTVDAKSAALKGAIEHTNGHNGKITGVTLAEIGKNTLTLTQTSPGVAGNTIITENLGNTTKTDFAGGTEEYASSYQGVFSNINLRQHTGRGDSFVASSTPVRKGYVYKEEPQLPEYASSTDMISVVSADTNVFSPSARPTDYYYALEKSMYASISKRMLQLFASIEEMNNLIGEPVNIYRPNYKSMEKLRQIFFNKVGNIPDLEKYVSYYKWIDSSIGDVVEQLYPASSPHAEGVRTVVESHLLERPKYKYTFLGDRKNTFPPGGDFARGTMGSQPLARAGLTQQAYGAQAGIVRYTETRAPLPSSPQKENEHSFWWKYKAERTNPTISSSVPGVNAAKQQILSVLQSEITASKVVKIGGSVYKSQGIGQTPGTYKYPSIRDITFGDFREFKDTTDVSDPKVKIKTVFAATNDNEVYSGELLVPFTAYSSSVDTGYMADVTSNGLTGTIITNLHEPAETLQGPFTFQHVGGLQSRHVSPLRQSDRKEAFALEFIATNPTKGRIRSLVTGTIPKGSYRRTLGAASPINIANIRTNLQNLDGVVTGGVNPIGNFAENYEVLQTSDRSSANMDFLFHNNLYYTGSIPTPFLRSISMMSLDRSGSADYYNPRQRGPFGSAVDQHSGSLRRNKTVITNRFSSPGGKFDSNQQFRDIPSDQYSPNNALPFRNIDTRKPYLKELAAHVNWGGFSGSSDEIMRDFTPISPYNSDTVSYTGPSYNTNSQVALDFLNEGVQQFGYPSASLFLSNAQFADGEPLQFITPDGDAYEAETDSTVPTANSTATEIGINGLSPGSAGDVDLAMAISISLTAWVGSLSNPFKYTVLSNTSTSVGGSTTVIVSLRKNDFDDQIIGTNFTNELSEVTGVTPIAMQVDPKLIAKASPYHKTQRNATNRVVIGSTDHVGSGGANNELYRQNYQYDNAFVTRPIPQADRTNWFKDMVSGSDNPATFSQYMLSGSRYPSDIYRVTASLGVVPGTVGQAGLIAIASLDRTEWYGRTTILTDSAGLVLTLAASTAGSPIALNSFTRNSTRNYTWGVGSGTTTLAAIRNSQLVCLRAAKDTHGDIGIEANTAASVDFGLGEWPAISLTQSAAGTSGNTSIAGTTRQTTSPLVSFFVDFTLGSDAHERNPIGSVFTASSGQPNYKWVNDRGFAPWSQTRAGQSPEAVYYAKNNVYEFAPVNETKRILRLPSSKGFISTPSTKGWQESTKSRHYTDRFTGVITSSFSERYVEPPITSRYKPIIHQIETTRGTPAKTNYDDKVDVTLKYSYGNLLQGFANKEINIKLGEKAGYNSGKIRRPYEVLRDNYVDKVQRNTTGAELIKMMVYSETIFPRERYTYLSGTRQRLAFSQDSWRNDISGTMGAATQISDVTLPNALKISAGNRPSLYEYNFIPFDDSSDTAPAIDYLRQGNSQHNRLVSPFITSQGYTVRFDEQAPVFHQNVANAPGTGSMWPLDSHLFSDPASMAYLERNFSGSTSNDINVLGSFMGTHAAGELMMTHYGRVLSGTANELSKERNGIPGTSSLNSSQYVYNVPSLRSGTSTVYLGNPALKPNTYAVFLERRAPGGAITMPPWTAASERRFVDGANKAKLAPPRTPMYETYEEYIQDVRLKGQDHSIIPEFRISELIPSYDQLSSITALVTASFELTGASENVYNGSHADFMPRYGTTDVIEYLSPFMSPGSKDSEFNKNPRHFGIESKVIMKLLPYDGFYPVNRTLQIATLFSQSYAPFAKFYGGVGDVTGFSAASSASLSSRWRILSRPFYAPGILYNSIKSGVGVQYPVRRESYTAITAALDNNGAYYVEGRFRLHSGPASLFGANGGQGCAQFLTGTTIGIGGISNNNEGPASNYFSPLHGCLSGVLMQHTQSVGGYPVLGRPAYQATVPSMMPGNRRRRVEGNLTNFDWGRYPDTMKFFWSDVIPFEGILKPLEHIGQDKSRVVCSDINDNLYIEVSGAIEGVTETRRSPDGTTKTFSDLLYRMSISNFLANVPQFFLKKKNSGGYMTKFVGKVPSKGAKTDPAGVQKTSQVDPNKMAVSNTKAYIMEIGLKKTDNFNLYNNPYAFGPPTSTGSFGWEIGAQQGGGAPATTSSVNSGVYPQGKDWPQHRGEFAPFAPTYYYGPSLVRITYTPQSSAEVSLAQILNSNDVSVEYLNSNGYYYDFDSGSYANEENELVDTSGTPFYGWNRAWQNRQDLDASVVIDNLFPSEAGAKLKPLDPNKWVIMPKWECPALDFSGSALPAAEDPTGNPYNFSSSLEVGNFNMGTKGMWHQYGLMPRENEGIYLYISDIDESSTEFRLVGNPTGSAGSFSTATGFVKPCKKASLAVLQSGREIASLASLVGFDETEIMPANAWDPTRAKRIGELAEDSEKTMSEAILAIPYYYDSESDKMRSMMLKASYDSLGPKIKEFRRAFTKYSFPPSLRKSLVDLLPPNYPKASNFINPFGGDDYDSLLVGDDLYQAPIIYLMEHSVELSRQDLADMWQNVMPDIGKTLKTSVTAIDHYMPGVKSEEVETVFPEILRKELELGLPRSGHPRHDLIDTEAMGIEDGFQPEIRWLILKVKQRGQTDYTTMMIEEINEGHGSLAFDNVFGYVGSDIPEEHQRFLRDRKNIYTKGLYHVEELGKGRNTYNWPYDYCSLIESAKINVKVGFRPELSREVEEFDKKRENNPIDKAPQPNIDIENIQSKNLLLPDLKIMQNLVFAPPPISLPSPISVASLPNFPLIPNLAPISNINIAPIPNVNIAPIPNVNIAPIVSPNIQPRGLVPNLNLQVPMVVNLNGGGNRNRGGGGGNFGGGNFGGGGGFGGY